MWGTIADFKENLNKIALDVHHDGDDDDDDESPTFSDRRSSRASTHSNSIPRSPLVNGITDRPYASAIEQYTAEIKRLQASEAEIKALSVNYAALLKEKEDQINRLNKENVTLKQNLETSSPASSNGNHKFKGSSDQSPNRQHRLTTQMKNAVNNGTMSTLQVKDKVMTIYYFGQS